MADHLWVDRRITRDIVGDLRVHNRLLETGGALFGYEVDGDVVVTHAPGLQLGRRRPWNFEPDRDEVDALIGHVHASSHGVLRYLGSWHTHPGGAAYPSATDTKTAARMSAQEDLELPEPLLLIVATNRAPWRGHLAETAFWQWRTEPEQLRRQREVWVSLDWRTPIPGL